MDRRFPLLRAAAAAAVTAVATTSTSKHFAVNKLGEIADKVLLLARSECEVKKGLVFDRIHEQLQRQEAVNT